MFICELTGCGFESSCSHSNFRFWACFEQGVLWHSGNYRVWIHSETLTCMMRTYSCKWYKASRAYHVRCYKGMKSSFNFNSTETISGLRAKTTFKIRNFCFSQILTGIVEEQHVLTPFNFFFKFSHCLTKFPIFLVHVNWITFYVTAHLFKFYYQQILRITKAEHEITILYELEKW